MVYKRYESPFEETRRNVQPECPPASCPPAPVPRKKDGIFKNIGNDDLILIGLILVLLLDDTQQRDYPLIIALGFLLISGWM